MTLLLLCRLSLDEYTLLRDTQKILDNKGRSLCPYSTYIAIVASDSSKLLEISLIHTALNIL
jgi:hypothetical protein